MVFFFIISSALASEAPKKIDYQARVEGCIIGIAAFTMSSEIELDLIEYCERVMLKLLISYETQDMDLDDIEEDI